MKIGFDVFMQVFPGDRDRMYCVTPMRVSKECRRGTDKLKSEFNTKFN